MIRTRYLQWVIGDPDKDMDKANKEGYLRGREAGAKAKNYYSAANAKISCRSSASSEISSGYGSNRSYLSASSHRSYSDCSDASLRELALISFSLYKDEGHHSSKHKYAPYFVEGFIKGYLKELETDKAKMSPMPPIVDSGYSPQSHNSSPKCASDDNSDDHSFTGPWGNKYPFDPNSSWGADSYLSAHPGDSTNPWVPSHVRYALGQAEAEREAYRSARQ